MVTKVKANMVDADVATQAELDAESAARVAAGSVTAAMLVNPLDLSSKTLTLPPDGSRAGDIVQIVNSQTGAVVTGTTAIPYDDTIPQQTEGDQYLSATITPKSATNNLMIEVCLVATSTGTNPMMMALFKDAGADAIAAVVETMAATGFPQTITLRHFVVAGGTSATTFKVRAGAVTGTMTVNGTGGARRFGGVMASSITVTEIKV